LIANNSVLRGVHIIALEGAHVILRNTTTDGGITTASDSYAQIATSDSELLEPITLSGNAVGHLANTSVPSVSVQDGAIAYVDRWIHVTVLDGAGYPLPDAFVTARYQLNDTLVTSGCSDCAGSVLLSVTGTIISSVGSTFVGDYIINASFSHHGSWSYGNETTVTVMPYTEPLISDNTFMTIMIPGALPDLILMPDALTISPMSPKNHEWTYVNVTLGNVGAVAANNVSADFYDTTVYGTELIGPGNVESVPVDSVASITIMWQAHEPLDPITHNISVVLDPMNTVPELNEDIQTANVGIVVQNLPDIVGPISDSDIWTSPSPTIINTAVSLDAIIFNFGDKTAANVVVEFYDEPLGGTAYLVDSTVISSISRYQMAVASVIWVPVTVGNHTIHVLANGGNTGAHFFDELDFSNNEGARDFMVLGPPDLVLTDLTFNPPISIPGGNDLRISSVLTNTEAAPVLSTIVALYIGTMTGAPVQTLTIFDLLVNGSSVTVEFTYTTPAVMGATAMTFIVVANPTADNPVEIDYTNNVVLGTITILDARPDLAVSSSNIAFGDGGDQTSASVGETLKIEIMVSNFGYSPASNISIAIGVRNLSETSNETWMYFLCSLSSDVLNHTGNFTYEWYITLNWSGEDEVWILVDCEDMISELDETNNFARRSITVSHDELPVADAGLDQAGISGETIWFDGGGSHDDVGIVNFTWTFTYEGTPVVIYGEKANFTFFTPGTYDVVLTVTDSSGQTANDTVQVMISYAIPEFPALALPIVGILLIMMPIRIRAKRLRNQ
jgi:subtilase family serine protease